MVKKGSVGLSSNINESGIKVEVQSDSEYFTNKESLNGPTFGQQSR